MTRRPGSRDPARPTLPEITLARSVAPDRLAAMRRENAWRPVRRGAVVELPPGLGPFAVRQQLALARIAAVVARADRPAVISHTSAARLWGLPSVDDGRFVHVIQQSNPKREDASDVRRHRHRLADGDAVVLGGVRVTSLDRTVLDCTTTLRPQHGMVIADAGLRLGADVPALLERLDATPGLRGARRARAVLSLADDGAESAGESLLRFIVLRAGFPVPCTQVRVGTPEGTFWADLGWEERRVLAEYDGVAKYSAAGPAAGSVVGERRREVLIERQDWRMARAASADIHRPDSFLAHLARLLHLAGTLTPRPWLT